jgi:putative addiction module component (TIGR02574 family)
MNATTKRLLTGALELSDAERAELAAELIESLDREADDDATAAWNREVQRRVAELDDGSVPPIPWPEARKMIMG